jgi:GH35 family endo-1,4-beta-xylanase
MKSIAWLFTLLSFASAAAPEGGVALVPKEPGAFTFVSDSPQQALAEIVPVAGQAFEKAWRIDVLAQPPNPWKVQLTTRSAAPVKRGDALWARFFLRCTASRQESGEGRLTLVFETVDENHDKSIDLTVGARGEWKEFAFPFICRHDLAAGGAQIALRAGFRPQTIEIGGFEILNYGTSHKLTDLPRTRADYPGREADAPWRKQARERIEKIRKGDFRVQLRDEAGKPLAGTQVKYALRRHGFGFGSAIDSSVLLREDADGERYRETIGKYFSRVVYENEFKWHTWERHGEAEHSRSLKSIDWFAQRGIAMRGHVLVWPSWQYLPQSARALRDQPDALRKHADQHIREMVGRTRGRFTDWDVINEPFAHNDLMNLLGDEVMVEWFKAARATDPDVKLFLNDYAGLANEGLDTPHKDHFEKTARFLINKGAPISGIGLQCHFGWSVTPPELALKELDRWGALGLEVQITEFDVESTDEELQADYTRDLLTLAFSHPSVTAIMIWGFWEGRHWKPDAALWRRDWSIKPNGKVWTDLTMREWTTHGEAITDNDGWISFRGFHGTYTLEVGEGGTRRNVEVALDKSQPSALVDTIPTTHQ